MASNEHEEPMDHEYDGIREYDNPLPGWWVQIFVGSILFAIGYAAYYGADVPGRTKIDAYEAEVKEANELQAHLALSAPVVTTEGLAAVRKDAEHLKAGRAIFALRCMPCHGPEGQGLVGPNLTDAYWIHGQGRLLDIYAVVRDGVADKGMPTWGKLLSDQELREVVAFVSTLRGTHPANPKAPQGEKVDGPPRD